jgi:hypothetical protein
MFSGLCNLFRHRFSGGRSRLESIHKEPFPSRSGIYDLSGRFQVPAGEFALTRWFCAVHSKYQRAIPANFLKNVLPLLLFACDL